MTCPNALATADRPLRCLPGALLTAEFTTLLAACATREMLPPESRVGSDPTLPAPESTLIPTVQVARAVGWSGEQAPFAAAGLQVRAFARDLDHPRWLYVLPNGDVLVAESNAPPKQDPPRGLRAWAMRRAMQRAGAAVPSADRITLLRDADGDGVAETRQVFRTGLRSPFGMALVDGGLFVATTDALLRFDYRDGDLQLRGEPRRVAPLPAGPINHHWTRNVLASEDGRTLFVTVGSNSNVGESGLEHERGRALILAVDARSGVAREFAVGLRNPNGLDREPATRAMWTVVNERDELGDDLVPDYLTRVEDGDHFGWPWSYYGQHADPRVQPPRPDIVARARRPDYALGSHVAPLGLVFQREGGRWPARFAQGAFIGLHGSWNRMPPSGYEVVFVAFDAGRPRGAPIPVLSAFLDEKGHARGRPVGVALARDGALLVADDVGNRVWHVAPR